MVFNTSEFFVFFAIVLALYYCLDHRRQNLLLVVSSYVFYGWWDWRFTILLFVSTLIDYVCGLCVSGKRGKLWLWGSVVSQLAILGYFKYFNFFQDSLCELFGLFGTRPSWTTLNIILPVGISFYTFQSLSYTIDIYRGRFKPVKNFIDFAVFVSFWPQLVAGPILRAKTLLPQIQARRKVSTRNWSEGTYFILVGLVKKVAIADMIAVVTDPVLRDPASYSSTQLLLNTYLCYLRIYCDFSGYTDIAKGSSLFLGFRLVENFRFPYLASGMQDFWQRWHMSLSTWLRDYVYKSLGRGEERRKWRIHFNIMVTMVLCGLWHGGGWNFVVWGTLLGIYLCIGYAISKPVKRLETAVASRGLGPALNGLIVVFTQSLFAFTGVYFFMPFWTATTYLVKFSGCTYSAVPVLGRACIYTIAVLMVCDLPEYLAKRRNYLADSHWLVRVAVYSFFLILLVGTWTKEYEPYIYFQF